MYLSTTSEALSIITGLSSFHFYTRMGYPYHSFNALQDFVNYFGSRKNSIRTPSKEGTPCHSGAESGTARPRGLGQGVPVLCS